MIWRITPKIPAKLTFPADTIQSTARPVRIGTYNVRIEETAAKIKDRVISGVYFLI